MMGSFPDDSDFVEGIQESPVSGQSSSIVHEQSISFPRPRTHHDTAARHWDTENAAGDGSRKLDPEINERVLIQVQLDITSCWIPVSRGVQKRNGSECIPHKSPRGRSMTQDNRSMETFDLLRKACPRSHKDPHEERLHHG